MESGATLERIRRVGMRERVGARVRERHIRRPPAKRVLLWISVILIMLFCLFPFYWLINVSMKTGADLSNSAIIAGTTTVLSLLIGSFAGYALARLRFPRKFLLLALVLSISTFPPIAIAAPLFKLWTDIGLFNTYIGLILPSLTFALPLTIYILASFFKEIPKELEEAALVDGATRFQAFRKVVVPLSAPGMVTAGLLVFIFAWNEFLFAITLTSTPDRRPVPAAIAFFTGSSQFEIPLGTISAASVVVTVPLIILVLIFQKRIVAGLTAGAVKA
jgi:multiple sugar transport system permease protein